MIYFFIAFGVMIFVSVAFTLVKIVKGQGFTSHSSNQDTSVKSNGETERLCRTLDGEALYKLAQGLVDEDGYKTDYSLWLTYINASADKGYVPALRELGLYHKWDDNNLAVSLLERAAGQGDATAAVELGDIYKRGVSRGKPVINKNLQLAEKWYKTAAENGDVSGQKALAEYYYYQADNEKAALEWYLKAVEQGDPEAMCQAAEIYGFNDQDDKALELYLKAAEQNYADAECSLGNYYCDMETEYKTAFDWYSRAAEHGDKFAMCRLGEMSLAGEGVLKDASAAFGWFEKASKEGSVYGKYLLGKCYFDGEGVAQDIKKGISLYTEAAKYDDDAQYALGECYLTGNGVKKDIKKAVEYFSKAEREPKAAYKLGEIYYSGDGVKKDDEKARECWRRAARYGNDDAKECLKIYFGET